MKRISMTGAGKVGCLLTALAFAACGGGGGGGTAPGPGQPGQPTAPTADAFESAGNITLTVAAPGLLANDPAGTRVLNPGTRATASGSVTVNADGSFTFTPTLGTQNVVDTFSYLATGNVPVQVSITLTERVWCVNNAFAGTPDGTSAAPFPTLAAAQAVADVGDTLFVYAGDETDSGQNVGLTLEAGQKLIGQGTGLTIGGRTIIAAGARPVISNAGAVALVPPVLTLASGNEVAGIRFLANNVTDNAEAILGDAIAGFNIHDNVITAPTREGIHILSPTGTGTIAANTITGAALGREGILISNSEDAAGIPVPIPAAIVATLTITGNTISGTATQQGIRVNLDGAGTNVKLAITSNTISDSGAEGIRLDTGPLGAAVSADVVGNTLTGNGVADFQAQANGTSSLCIELMNNGNAGNNATFLLTNNTPATAVFQIFELGNDTPTTRNAPASFTDVLQGACGVP